MARRRKLIALAIVVLVVVLVLAWRDAGREEQRMIVQPVELPTEQTEQGR